MISNPILFNSSSNDYSGGGNMPPSFSEFVSYLGKTVSPFIAGMIHGSGNSLGNVPLELLVAGGIPQLACISNDVKISRMCEQNFQEEYDLGPKQCLSYNPKKNSFKIIKLEGSSKSDGMIAGHLFTGIASSAIYGVGYTIGHFCK